MIDHIRHQLLINRVRHNLTDHPFPLVAQLQGFLNKRTGLLPGQNIAQPGLALNRGLQHFGCQVRCQLRNAGIQLHAHHHPPDQAHNLLGTNHTLQGHAIGILQQFVHFLMQELFQFGAFQGIQLVPNVGFK